jgi:Holliday junction resolvase RusA-like endonuclease
MTQPLSFFVPGAPMGWQRPDSNGRRRYAAPRTAAKEREVAWHAKAALVGRSAFAGAVVVCIKAHMPIPESWSKKKKASALEGSIYPTAKPDIDNVCKLALDALNGVAWKDDASVVSIIGLKVFAATPGLEIRVEAA